MTLDTRSLIVAVAIVGVIFAVEVTAARAWLRKAPRDAPCERKAGAPTSDLATYAAVNS